MEKTLKGNLLSLLIGVAFATLLSVLVPSDILMSTRSHATVLLGVGLAAYVAFHGYHRFKNKTLVSFTKGFISAIVPFCLMVITPACLFYVLLQTNPSMPKLRYVLLCFAPLVLALVWIGIAKNFIVRKNRLKQGFMEGIKVAEESSALTLVTVFAVMILFVATNIPW